eukprot:scaffold27676_cov84-Amphora_coffeaeformis.AAC.2
MKKIKDFVQILAKQGTQREQNEGGSKPSADAASGQKSNNNDNDDATLTPVEFFEYILGTIHDNEEWKNFQYI